MFFKHSETQPATPMPAEQAAKKTISSIESILANSLLYQFKRNVLELVAHMNQGVKHADCEILKRQTMFVQTQLLHGLTNDPSLPPNLRIMLMDYHAKSIRATLSEKRGEHLRDLQL